VALLNPGLILRVMQISRHRHHRQQAGRPTHLHLQSQSVKGPSRIHACDEAGLGVDRGSGGSDVRLTRDRDPAGRWEHAASVLHEPHKKGMGNRLPRKFIRNYRDWLAHDSGWQANTFVLKEKKQEEKEPQQEKEEESD
jgi:hypothetical protein